ncbi:gamma-glutamyltransferase [Paenibacillus psychroresistens]|uniref:Glutathione hydrolase proenzyme n=1 Tax=Paenibacillus psychroresistens TaxID=1778678 RepID=A0A6B8RRA3_9BACL|nr:gamma-glutamyltransferase [Paenibacillus psychroresistens]QGQ98344.1 gamma-glutamyltransferase [Paenibacillus psychroresistens]
MQKSIIGTKAMVVSPHYLASAAGARILQKGGNAYDAAIAVSACLAVVYPHMTGLGGDSFWLMYNQKAGNMRAYNGSGRSGSEISRETFTGEKAIPHRGIRSIITVPGMVDSWEAILSEYGRLTLAEVLEPAITYAAEGFPLSNNQYENTVYQLPLLSQMPITSDIYVPGGQAPQTGSKFIQKQLAQSLRELAAEGRDSFYKGTIANKIVAYLQENGGLLTLADFANHHGEWTTPVTGNYRGYDIYQVPPNSQGFVGIMALNILEKYNLNEIPHGSYEYYHLLVEALKLSFQDRNRVLTDPEFSSIPLEQLLSKAYAEQLAQKLQMNLAKPFQTEPLGSDTAYAAVVDEEGNAVSFIQSLYFEFGSGVVAGETGILMQNRGSFFSLDPNHVNCLEPNKRTFHTLMPAMACRAGKPYILYGTQGGEGQPQTQTAIITRMLDYGMDPQSAINQPRFVWGKTWGEDTQELKVEGRVSQETLDRLGQAGHLVRKVADYDSVVGHAHAIQIDDNGFRIGGTDPRADGAAIGW